MGEGSRLHLLILLIGFGFAHESLGASEARGLHFQGPWKAWNPWTEPLLHHPVHYHGVHNYDYNSGPPAQTWVQWILVLALPIIIVPLISILFISFLQENSSGGTYNMGGLAGPGGLGLGSSPVQQTAYQPVLADQGQVSSTYGAPSQGVQQPQQPSVQYGISRIDNLEEHNKLTQNVLSSIKMVADNLQNKVDDPTKLQKILGNLN